MTHRITLEQAYILHRRPYSNTSLLVEFFTENHGRQVMLARSARGLKSRYRGKLEPFTLMLISWSGKSELKFLGNVEFCDSPSLLQGNVLVSGFYLNEILLRLLQREDPCSALFAFYHQALQNLKQQEAIEITLRIFEKKLLQELGFGLSFATEYQTKKPIIAEEIYQYIADSGFQHVLKDSAAINLFRGASLLALEQEQFMNIEVLKEAKRLMRLVLSSYLGDKPLKSRELLMN